MERFYDALLRNEGQVLTPELITGLMASLSLDGVSAVGAVHVPDSWHDDAQWPESLVFDEKESVAAWVAEQVEQSGDWGSYYAMGVRRADGELLAGIVFNAFNGVNAQAHIAVRKVTKTFPLLLRAAADYAFRQCRLTRLTGLVESGNERALRLDEHIGFERECTLKRAGRDGQDIEVLVLWADKCRWLETEQ